MTTLLVQNRLVRLLIGRYVFVECFQLAVPILCKKDTTYLKYVSHMQQVAAERGGDISPRMTRSAKKSKPNRLPPFGESSLNLGGGDIDGGQRRLMFSPSVDNQEKKGGDISPQKTPFTAAREQVAASIKEEIKQGMNGQNETLRTLQEQMSKLLESSSDKSTFLALEQRNEQLYTELENAHKQHEEERLEWQQQLADSKSQFLVQHTKLESQVEAANLELSTMKEEKKELHAKMEAMKEEFLVEKTRLEGEIDGLNREATVKLEGLGESRKGLEEQLSHILSEKSQLTEQLSTAQGELSTLKDQMSDLKCANTELKQGMEAANGDLERQKITMNDAEQESKASISQLTDDLEKQTCINDDLSAELESAQQANLLLKTELAQANDNLESLKNGQLATLSAEQSALEAELSGTKKKLADANKMLEQMEQDLDELEHEKEAESNELKKQRVEALKEKEQELEEIAEELSGVEARLVDEQSKRADAEKQVETLESKFTLFEEDSKQSVDTLTEQVRDLEQEKNATEVELKSERETVQSLFNAKT